MGWDLGLEACSSNSFGEETPSPSIPSGPFPQTHLGLEAEDPLEFGRVGAGLAHVALLFLQHIRPAVLSARLEEQADGPPSVSGEPPPHVSPLPRPPQGVG
jgi:hypothetical protein